MLARADCIAVRSVSGKEEPRMNNGISEGTDTGKTEIGAIFEGLGWEYEGCVGEE